jgi:predicted transcriptional regulator
MPQPPLPGGDLERAVIETVWDLGKASAREVHDRVGAPSGLAYTTIAKVLDRLVAKKLCKRRREGRIYMYASAVTRQRVERADARSTVGRLLGDEPRPAIATLVDAVESVDPELLDELARVVAARRKARRGS